MVRYFFVLVMMIVGINIALSHSLFAKGKIAIVDLSRHRSSLSRDFSDRASLKLKAYLGAWAKQPGVEDHLLNRDRRRILPEGELGQNLSPRLKDLRYGGRLSTSKLWELGRLLAVDYLLLLKFRDQNVSARLFSIHRQVYAPQGFEGALSDVDKLKAYLLDQTKEKPKEVKSESWTKKWWVWAIIGSATAISAGFALAAQKDDSSGRLTIEIRH